MNPLLERNKSIYRLLMIVSAGLGLLSVLLIAFVWKEGIALRIYFVLLFIFSIPLILFVSHKSLTSPKHSQPVGLRMFSLRARRKPASEPPADLDGWRYVKVGATDLLTVLFFLLLALWMVFLAPVPEYWTWIATGLFFAGKVAINIWHSRKLSNQS